MLYSDVVARMVVPAYPFGAEMVKRSGVSLMLFGRGMAGAIVVGTGIGVVGTGVETAVGVSVGTVVGTGVGCRRGLDGLGAPGCYKQDGNRTGKCNKQRSFHTIWYTWQLI